MHGINDTFRMRDRSFLDLRLLEYCLTFLDSVLKGQDPNDCFWHIRIAGLHTNHLSIV